MTEKRSVKKIIASTLMGLAVTISTACSPVRVLNGLVPDDGYNLHADIPFGNLSRQQLDIYQPRHVNHATPVVIFYYGGSWDSGNKADYKFVAEALTSHGFITVIPDYRVYPDVLFPEFMADPAQATLWVKQNIHKFNGDPNRIFSGRPFCGCTYSCHAGCKFRIFIKSWPDDRIYSRHYWVSRTL